MKRAWCLVELVSGEFWLVLRTEETMVLDGKPEEIFHFMVDQRAKGPLEIKQWWFLCNEGEPLPDELPVNPSRIEIAVEGLREQVQ